MMLDQGGFGERMWLCSKEEETAEELGRKIFELYLKRFGELKSGQIRHKS
jgi:hypothetical protein